MTNVSRAKVASREYKLAEKELVKIISKTKGATSFVDELLTESEKVMIIKRFAAVFMFERGYSPYRVSDSLAMSLSTAQRLEEKFNEEGYVQLTSSLMAKEKNAFLSVLEDLILAQVSPRARKRLMKRVL